MIRLLLLVTAVLLLPVSPAYSLILFLGVYAACRLHDFDDNTSDWTAAILATVGLGGVLWFYAELAIESLA